MHVPIAYPSHACASKVVAGTSSGHFDEGSVWGMEWAVGGGVESGKGGSQ